VFDREQNALIERLIQTHPPVVALFKSVPNEVIGWACRDFDTIHYVYVKHDYRRQGVANLLISGAKFYTHETKAGLKLFARSGVLFNPYKAGSP
jgi:GNAT superfamily N-acetyltransferase